MEHESQSEASEGLIEASNSYSGSFEYLFNTSESLFEASKTPIRLLCERLSGVSERLPGELCEPVRGL